MKLPAIFPSVFLICALGATAPAHGAGTYSQVQYPPSTAEGELQVGVTYTIWIPDGAPRLRGIIVHQHGAGTTASKEGSTAAYDLHWQALAKKWDCALLGPSYHQEDGEDCRLWCDPRNGSRQTFLKALTGSRRAARHAGNTPATAPSAVAKPIARRVRLDVIRNSVSWAGGVNALATKVINAPRP